MSMRVTVYTKEKIKEVKEKEKIFYWTSHTPFYLLSWQNQNGKNFMILKPFFIFFYQTFQTLLIWKYIHPSLWSPHFSILLLLLLFTSCPAHSQPVTPPSLPLSPSCPQCHCVFVELQSHIKDSLILWFCSQILIKALTLWTDSTLSADTLTQPWIPIDRECTEVTIWLWSKYKQEQAKVFKHEYTVKISQQAIICNYVNVL